MDYVFLVKNKAVGPIEIHVMTNSIGVVCGVRRADTGADGAAFIEDLLRYGYLTVVRDHGKMPVYTVVRK